MSLENKLLKTTLFVFLLISIHHNLYSQGSCNECCDRPLFGIPGESNSNRLEEDGKIFQYPFTMFNKTGKPGYWDLNVAVQEIRNKILQDKPYGLYYRVYKAIFDNADGARPEAGGEDVEGVSMLAGWTKNNAFVNLIQFDGNGNFINSFIKAKYALRAKDGLSRMNYEVNVCLSVNGACNLLQFRGKELIMYLQAYDLLKASGDISDDEDDDECSYRNKLRIFTRYFYYSAKGPTGIIDSPTGWKKNHGLMACGALGVAAVVLNDAGVKPMWLNSRWSPHTWAREAINGIEDNLFVGWHSALLFAYDVPMSDKYSMTGYAEGPSYFNYAFENLIPFFRAMSNFVPENSDRNYFSRVKNPDIMRILDWADSIQSSGNWTPGFDNSGATVSSILGATGLKEFHANGVIIGNVDLRADFLASLTDSTVKDAVQNPITILPSAGSAMIRSEDDSGSYHTFHLLFEEGKSITPLDNLASAWSHEDYDFGSFAIYADDQPLAIDPAYLSSPFSDFTHKMIDHNYAFFNNGELSFNKNNITSSDQLSNLKLEYEQVDKPAIYLPPFGVDEKIGDIERDVTRFKANNTIYYILNDKFSSESENESCIAINGNGNINDSTFFRTSQSNANTYNPNGRVFKWTHPSNRPKGVWNLLAHNSILNTGATLTIQQKTGSTGVLTFGTEHGDPGLVTTSIGTKSIGDKISWSFGLHTRIEVIHGTENSLIQTFLMPYRKGDSLPLISRKETSTYITTTLQFIGERIDYTKYYKKGSPPPGANPIDTSCDFHLVRRESGVSEVTDPFNLGVNSDTIKTDGKKAFARFSTLSIKTEGFCAPSFIKINTTSITNGTYVSFEDTLYIEASTAMNLIEYSYVSKFRYEGYCSGIGNVKFYLPDMQYGYPLKATGHVGSYSHNDTGDYKFITIYFSGPGKFVIELKNPCMDDCYFPPTNMTIDSTFNFDIGSLKSLSHDLDIISGDGVLNLTKASRMSICPDNVLVNKDSIVMHMGCSPEKRWIVKEDGTKTFLPPDTLKYLCNRDELLKDRAENTTRNMIIVNDKAGLVLDSGSVTHIGLNSTILIRPGGTLIIKAGARVIVGDSNCVQNRGELLADHGSYICIEEGAHIEFYNDIDSFNFYYKDTIDRHIVYFAMPDAGGSGGAIAGKNPSGGRGKFMSADDGGGLWSSGICVPFCELKYKNPPYGIENRPFGWCNVSQPRAFFTSPDTLCINKPFGIDATRSLNETGYFITVCKYDTGSQTCITQIDSIADNGDKCLSKLYLFTPTESGYYRVRLIVRNDCNQTDTFTKILYVPSLPVASFTLSAATICPGNGTLTANGATSTSKINRCKHRWTIEPLMEDSTKLEAMFGLQGNKDWLMDSMTFVDSAFNFPGYHFTGGLRYLVSLTVWGWCSDSTVWDTVDVPLKVKIDMEAATTAYSNPVGPAAVRLKGIVLNATSWNWSPTDYLDYPDSLNPIATPPDSIVYVLTGALGGCSTSDTVTIWHNNRAYAGVDRSVCFNQKTVLGTDYNAAALIGLLQYKGGDSFWDIYAPTRTDDNNDPRPVQKYLTQYLIETALSQSTPEFINVMWLEQSEIRNAIITHPNFAQFFLNFVNSNGSNGSLAYFDSYVINTDSALKAAIDNLPSYYGYETQTEDYFTAFNDWYNENTSNSGFTDIVWEKITEDTICSLTQWRKHYNILLDTIETATYRMTLIDNVNSKVEFDEVKVIVDTLTVPSFEIAYQIDSTLYFINMSGTNPFYSYEWNFGDGSSSVNTFHASHTFPAFDSAYVVCLSLTNNCGTYIYCDTIRVDSSGLDDQGMGKRSLADTKNSTSNTDDKHIPQIVKNEVLLDNIPNPFTESTNITYAIGKDYKSAELRITDILGRIVKVYMLSNPKGQLIFDASPYEGGLYYSSLIVDGVIVKSKTMVIER